MVLYHYAALSKDFTSVEGVKQALILIRGGPGNTKMVSQVQIQITYNQPFVLQYFRIMGVGD